MESAANAAAVAAARLVAEQDEAIRREESIVAASEARRCRNRGRTLDSIAKNPRRSGGEASSERGPALLTHHIVIGGRDEANNEECLAKLGISHILNAANNLPNFFEDKFVYLHLPLYDSEDEKIVNVMPRAIDFVKRVEQLKGRVLIHCVSGVSRSVTICVLYLVMHHKLPLRDAYNYVYSCRPFIAPNDGFKLQMAEAEIAALKYSSVCGNEGGKHWDFFQWNSRKFAIQDKQNREGEGGEIGGRVVRRKPLPHSSADVAVCNCCVVA